MRIVLPLSVLATAALLLGGTAAHAQQKNQPKGQGAGTECSRITDAKKRDECVHQAQQKERAAKEVEKKGGGATKSDAKGKKN